MEFVNGTIFSEWNVQGKVICLFQENLSLLSYSVDGRGGSKKFFRPKVTSIEYSQALIKIFHKTIQENLENVEVITSSAFLPTYYGTVANNSDLLVVLFSHLDTSTNIAGAISWARWGLYSTSKKEEYVFNADPGQFQILHYFLTSFVLDSVIERTLAFSYYLRQFGVFFTERRVLLKTVSVLDKKTCLDEDQWSLTLVSHRVCTEAISLFNGKIGHAMLVCEGIENGKQFIKYIHAKQTNLWYSKGKVEILAISPAGKLIPTINGPTWSRPRSLIQEMFRFIDTLQGEVDFALYGDYFRGFRTYFNPPEENAIVAHSTCIRDPKTCLQWTRIIAFRCGIILNFSSPLQYPIDMVRKLQSSPAYRLPTNDSPFSCKVLSMIDCLMRDTPAFLAPYESSPEFCCELFRFCHEISEFKQKIRDSSITFRKHVSNEKSEVVWTCDAQGKSWFFKAGWSSHSRRYYAQHSPYGLDEDDIA